MTRNQRRRHAWVWAVLGPLILGGFLVSLLARPQPVDEPTPTAMPEENPNASAKTQP